MPFGLVSPARSKPIELTRLLYVSVWQTDTEILGDGRCLKLRISSAGKPLLYEDVIELWQRDESFCDYFAGLLAGSPFPAYFWETPPISRQTRQQGFEFVLVDSPTLARVSPDPLAFGDCFESASEYETVVEFPNLGGDAGLVVPVPQEPGSDYTHLAAFSRAAPRVQQQELWRRVGVSISRRLGNEPMWVSTSGLGVYWLHIRLDSYPKYYTHRQYRTAR